MVTIESNKLGLFFTSKYYLSNWRWGEKCAMSL